MNATQWRKREFEKKKIEKIHTLRKYAKLLKKENITDSKRFKVKDHQNNHASEGNLADGQANESSHEKSNTPQKKNNKKTPSKQEKFQEAKAAKEEERRLREEERIKKIQESIKRRKEERKVLTLKNKKGQPVLKGHIHKILGKLMKEKDHN